MKRQLTFMLLAVLCAMSAFAQNGFFEKCEKIKDVTTVYVSKAMLQMAGDMNVTGDMNLSSVIKKLDNIRIINAESAASAKEVKKLAPDFSTKNGYEILMSVNETDENVKIYMKTLAGGVNEYVIFVDEGDEVTIVIMTGTLTFEEVTKAVNVGGKSKK